MKTIVILNRKGGCGKTTVAVSCAAALADGGWKVALADADPQKSALRWLKRRPARVAAISPVDWTVPGAAGNVPAGIDMLVVDTPAGIGDGALQGVLARADLVIAPVVPSFFDENATRHFLRDLVKLRRIRKNKAGLEILGNRLRPRGRAEARLQQMASKLGQPLIASLSDRVAYGDLAQQGLTIFDVPHKRLEPLRAQWSPVLRRLA